MTWGNRPRRHGTSGWQWQRTVQAIIRRDGGLCRFRLSRCTGAATTAGHIVAKAHGGSDQPHNLKASCAECNETKRRAEARARRRITQRQAEPHPGLLR